LRFASLGSGSRGNATLIEAGDSRVLLDCGFSCREMEQRLAALAVEPDSIDAILLSHEHGDHLRGAAQFGARWRVPLWMSHGTCLGGRLEASSLLHLFHPDQARFRVGNLEITPFTVPHDAREPCQYHFAANGLRLVVLTDLGCVTPHILEVLDGVDGLVLETNHDEQMLIDGPYRWPLKKRVGGDFGHLSNRQAADILVRLERGTLQHLVAAHLSEKNNTPERARETVLERVPDMEARLTLLGQDGASGWFTLAN
jgi:phosphoribosyl 1,2-cyclic phosphodiesterase